MQKEKIVDSSETRKVVDSLTLFDDYFMSVIFDKNIPATELVIRIILGRKDIRVKSVTSQRTLKSPFIEGKGVRLDILAEDAAHKCYNIEVQRDEKDASPKRARFHSSMVDSRMLKAGQKFNELTDSYVIFITEKDYYRGGLPIYTIDRQIKETDRSFEDGSHIIYVNGSYEGDDDIGRLMQDFKQTESEKMHNKILADNVRYVKGEKEDNEMSSLVEEYAEKVAKRYGESVAKEVEERVTKQVTKQVSLSTTIKTALAYGIDKKRIIDRLCSEFKLSEEEANKEYEKYVVTTA